jgi:uncharacterized UBP type Zn finger protein
MLEPSADEIATAYRGGCPECLAMGSEWLHLRMCLECGQVGCCDDSPQTHASKHWRATGHPVIRTLEPGETWAWNFETQQQVY